MTIIRGRSSTYLFERRKETKESFFRPSVNSHAIPMSPGKLTEMEKERYKRQLLIKGFGQKAQLSLARSTVGVLGVGGLGSPACMYLTAAGVGRLILIDDQIPEVSNLNRQVLHWERDVSSGREKVESAAWKLKEMNSDLEIVEISERVTKKNLSAVLKDADVMLDCTDNFETRYLLNRFCVEEKVPFVHAAVEGMCGQITTIVPGKTPCLRCLFPRPPPKRQDIAILGATAGVFGAMQATEAIKLITGVGETLRSKLLVGDLSCNTWDVIEVSRDKGCPVCRR